MIHHINLGQSWGSPVYKHKSLPIYISKEFVLYRCIAFKPNFYNTTISELHHGNLRNKSDKNRYSDLFPMKKTSYWCNDADTAIAEVQKHEEFNEYIIFMAYDDYESVFPTIEDASDLKLIDGRDIDFEGILNKNENNIELNEQEQDLIEQIIDEDLDGLVYNSVINPCFINYLLFEKGFKKLSLKSVKLTIVSGNCKCSHKIGCAFSSDYIAVPKNYGYFFKPLVKRGFDEKYLQTDEYKQRQSMLDKGVDTYRSSFKKQKN